jgi:AraC-like DNA-binding protein
MHVIDGDWLATVTDALQVLVGALSGHVSMHRVHDALANVREPRNPVESLLLLGRMSDLLVDIVLGVKPVVRLDALESVLGVWPSIRHHAAPLSALRYALDQQQGGANATGDYQVADSIREVLERRYAERLRLKDIAKELGVSESKASRCFRAVYRATIHQHLLVVRVKHGLGMVTQGAKIEAAAFAVGFRSKKDFYRAVQKVVGCTPAQFRAGGNYEAIAET